MIKNITYLGIAILILLPIGCSSEVNYESMVKKGLSSGVKADSLFLGYHFGMSIQDFHSSSLEMNRRGEITGYTKVIYRMESLPYPAIMEFYPTFKNNEIVRMPVTIGYEGWSPWNEHLFTQYLIDDIKEYYEGVYDADFVMIYVPEINKQALVDIQGNREIRIYPISQSTIMVDFIDLSARNSSKS